jgi:Ran GTPase-activating protein (RanGAP) involved in mRNA processing and transport
MISLKDFSAANVEGLLSDVYNTKEDSELEDFEDELRTIYSFIGNMLVQIGDRIEEMESEEEEDDEDEDEPEGRWGER